MFWPILFSISKNRILKIVEKKLELRSQDSNKYTVHLSKQKILEHNVTEILLKVALNTITTNSEGRICWLKIITLRTIKNHIQLQ
jgi:hypothetical protein